MQRNQRQGEVLDPAPRRSLPLRVLKLGPLRRFLKPAQRIHRGLLARKIQPELRGRKDLQVVYEYEQVWLAKKSNATASEVIEQNFQLVVDLLERESIPFFTIPDESRRRFAIGIEDAHWRRFARAIEDARSDVPIYLGVDALHPGGARKKTVTAVDAVLGQRALEAQDSVEVFQFHADAERSISHGRPYACTVSRWERDEADALRTASVNQRTTAIDSESQVERTIEVYDRSVASFEPLLKTNVFEHTEPIDAVYMWVDGGDPVWRAKRDRVLAEHLGTVPPDSTDESRFRDNGELRYSMRSIHEHCDWIRNIILVTDDQVPDWLDTNHERIRVVDHKELFGDAGRLPTFNSHAIAARLHHIEGLSERYLIFNDDVFIGRRVDPSQFFYSNGIAKFFLSKSTLPLDLRDAPAHEHARRNSADLIEREFGVRPTRNFYHTPVPQVKNVLLELEENFPAIFKGTWDGQFRSRQDYEINGWLHQYYAYMTKRAIPGSIRYDYYDLSQPDIFARLADLARRPSPVTFCINDNPDASPANAELLWAWMARKFNSVAPWEMH